MTHNLMERTIDGKTVYSLVYRDGMPTPWHNTQTNTPTFTHNDIFQAMEDTGANYTVVLRQSTIPQLNPMMLQQVWNDTNGVLLGQVGKSYTTIQNEYLFSLFHDVAVEHGLKLATLGVLGHGERAFASYLVTDDGGRQLFINLANSHNGNQSITISINHVMVVCQNTLRVSEGQGVIKTSHTKNAHIRLTGLAKFIDQQLLEFESAGKRLEDLKNVTSNPMMYRATIDRLTKAAGKDLEAVKRDKLREQLLNIYGNATGVSPDLVGTRYSDYMAVTEVLTHFRPTRGGAPNVALDRVFTPHTLASKLTEANKLMLTL
jgi:hypothetical protein